MPIHKNIGLNTHLKRLYSVMTKNKIKNLKNSSKKTAPQGKIYHVSHLMAKFFGRNPELSKIMPFIPVKYLRTNSTAEHHYLMSQKTAKDIVDKIFPFLNVSGSHLVAETNSGLGLIAIELLVRGIPKIRLYDSSAEFRTELKV